jgi:hypothetical protein
VPPDPFKFLVHRFHTFFPVRCALSLSVIITDSDRNLWLAVITLALADLTATKHPWKKMRALSFGRRIRIREASFESAITLVLSLLPSGADILT